MSQSSTKKNGSTSKIRARSTSPDLIKKQQVQRVLEVRKKAANDTRANLKISTTPDEKEYASGQNSGNYTAQKTSIKSKSKGKNTRSQTQIVAPSAIGIDDNLLESLQRQSKLGSIGVSEHRAQQNQSTLANQGATSEGEQEYAKYMDADVLNEEVQNSSTTSEGNDKYEEVYEEVFEEELLDQSQSQVSISDDATSGLNNETTVKQEEQVIAKGDGEHSAKKESLQSTKRDTSSVLSDFINGRAGASPLRNDYSYSNVQLVDVKKTLMLKEREETPVVISKDNVGFKEQTRIFDKDSQQHNYLKHDGTKVTEYDEEDIVSNYYADFDDTKQEQQNTFKNEDMSKEDELEDYYDNDDVKSEKGELEEEYSAIDAVLKTGDDKPLERYFNGGIDSYPQKDAVSNVNFKQLTAPISQQVNNSQMKNSASAPLVSKDADEREEFKMKDWSAYLNSSLDVADLKFTIRSQSEADKREEFPNRTRSVEIMDSALARGSNKKKLDPLLYAKSKPVTELTDLLSENAKEEKRSESALGAVSAKITHIQESTTTINNKSMSQQDQSANMNAALLQEEPIKVNDIKVSLTESSVITKEGAVDSAATASTVTTSTGATTQHGTLSEKQAGEALETAQQAKAVKTTQDGTAVNSKNSTDVNEAEYKRLQELVNQGHKSYNKAGYFQQQRETKKPINARQQIVDKQAHSAIDKELAQLLVMQDILANSKLEFQHKMGDAEFLCGDAHAKAIKMLNNTLDKLDPQEREAVCAKLSNAIKGFHEGIDFKGATQWGVGFAGVATAAALAYALATATSMQGDLGKNLEIVFSEMFPEALIAIAAAALLVAIGKVVISAFVKTGESIMESDTREAASTALDHVQQARQALQEDPTNPVLQARLASSLKSAIKIGGEMVTVQQKDKDGVPMFEKGKPVMEKRPVIDLKTTQACKEALTTVSTLRQEQIKVPKALKNVEKHKEYVEKQIGNVLKSITMSTSNTKMAPSFTKGSAGQVSAKLK